ncbi:MAG: DUF3562 domain-containing protein [Gammaproteobacteria bacterium]|jgi:hypothetical protein|nr:DUF3562 domain-containing protein [Gammaproteobacteria bacterium]
MNGDIIDKKESQRHLGFIHRIAEASGVPDEEVEKIYNAELEKLKDGARVRNFLPVLAGRKTREILRQLNYANRRFYT